MRDYTTADFETEKIESRPAYPPKPVGLALKHPDGSKEYLAWGHPLQNNCDMNLARAKLKDAYRNGPVLFHHAHFDMDVADIHMGLGLPARHEDTMYLSFLKDPFEKSLSLKPMAEKYLGMKPSEQDELRDWVIANVPEAKKKPSEWGAYISRAPGKLVGKYAIGDVDRTDKLYRKFRPEISERGMDEAYEREIALTPITMEMERSGIRVDVKRLKRASLVFQKFDEDMVKEIHKRLGVKDSTTFNLNSNAQLADALVRANKLDTIFKTPTGLISTKIENLKKGCNDPKLLQLLSVHSVVEKYSSSFIAQWIEKGEKTHGRLLPRFNQVRNRTDEDTGGGARSGRYSSSDPNMQNVSANVEDSANKETLQLMQKWLRDDYGFNFIGLRDFLIPDEDTVLISVDYNQQELRLLAHFEKGVLMRAYIENPDLDIHEFCRQLVHQATGILYERKHIKVTVFGILYGMGLEKLAARLKETREVASAVRNGILRAVPGIKQLQDDLKKLARKDRPLRTWGGREYFCEEPTYDEHRGDWRSYEYKMLNYQIQPSAADCTKQGMINVHEQVPEARIAIQVHDELVCMAPNRSYGKKISDAMCDMKFRIPMTADAKYSEKSWARASK